MCRSVLLVLEIILLNNYIHVHSEWCGITLYGLYSNLFSLAFLSANDDDDFWQLRYRLLKTAAVCKIMVYNGCSPPCYFYPFVAAPYLPKCQHATRACSHTHTAQTCRSKILCYSSVTVVIVLRQYGSKKNNKKSSKSPKSNIKNSPISLRDGDTVGIKVHVHV